MQISAPPLTAKQEIALTLFEHKYNFEHAYDEVIENDGPIMLVGPTGSGKTFIVQKACEAIDLPLVHINASAMVPEGIKGICVGEIVKQLFDAAKMDAEKVAFGVVFLDEIDKLFQDSCEQ